MRDSIQEHCPAVRAVVADEDVREEDYREGFGGITQPIDRFIEKSTQNAQLIPAHKADANKGD